MAIAFVGSSALAVDNDVGPITPALPSTTAGHVAILHVFAGATTDVVSVTPGGEWTAEYAENNGVPNRRTFIFSRVLTGGDTDPSVSASAAGLLMAVVSTFSGVDNTTPIDNSTETFSNGSGTTATAPTLNTATNGAYVLRLYGNNNINVATSPFSSTSEGLAAYDGASYATAVGSNGALGMSYFELATAGATGTATMTLANSEQWHATTMALRPSGGAADPEGSLIAGKLLRGGLLLHGVLGR